MKKLTILLAVLLCCTGCAAPIADPSVADPSVADLMKNITPNPVFAKELADVSDAAVTDFALRLFRTGMEDGKNTLLSPLSVLAALSMTANGTKGETLSQMEAVLGMPVEELNTWLHIYTANLPEEETYKLHLANSIWFTDSPTFTVNEDFLQTTADYYDAGIYRAPFDQSTCDAINSWVSDNTDGMIPQILEQIPEDAVMYLVNALAFDAQWQKPYAEYQIREGSFTAEDGTEQTTQMMYSEENRYLEDGKTVGFIKYYTDRKYAFAALLPEEGVTVSEYVAALTGERLQQILADAEHTAVETALPQFETSYDVEMSDILQTMGMTDAFDGWKADLTGLGTSTEGNINISRVLHKTYISVDGKGTKAAAATAVEAVTESAMEMPEPKRVYLDRPFVYMLIDCETNLPFFIGTLMTIPE
ncbi:MAG: serpin family protein [Clostridia bacterium]|nr:serpin family protein [Clostridia bacterium]